MTILVLATSLSGSEHVVKGGVRDRESYEWKTKKEAKEHLKKIGWTNVRFLIDEKTTGVGSKIRSWDNQSKTEHFPGQSTFIYLRGGPVSDT